MKNCNTFYSYKNGKTYSTCIQCFDKKVRCEFCNKELNKSYLRSHVKKQHLYQHYNRATANATANAKATTGAFAASRQLPHNDEAQGHSQLRTNINTGGDLLPTRQLPQLRDSCRDSYRDSYRTHNNNAKAIAKAIANDDNVEAIAGADAKAIANSGVNETNRTLIVGPSFCGKTPLLLNKLRLIRLEDPEKQIRIITRSPEQYEDVELYISGASQGIEVEENVGDLEEYRGCCVVFDDMLDSNQKLIEPFFTKGRHKSCDVYYLCQSYFDAPKKTVRNNSNVIILFQQTLKDVEHIHRDISGFDMSYEEFKSLCREAWNENFNYLLINRLEDKNGSRYRICNESNPNYKIFNPQTDPSSN